MDKDKEKHTEPTDEFKRAENHKLETATAEFICNMQQVDSGTVSKLLSTFIPDDVSRMIDWSTMRLETDMLEKAELDSELTLVMFSAEPTDKKPEYPNLRLLILVCIAAYGTQGILDEMEVLARQQLQDRYGTAVLPICMALRGTDSSLNGT